MDFRNTGHPLSDRISKEKRQHRNECPDQKKRRSHSRRKKDVSKRVNVKINQKTRISFSTKYNSTM